MHTVLLEFKKWFETLDQDDEEDDRDAADWWKPKPEPEPESPRHGRKSIKDILNSPLQPHTPGKNVWMIRFSDGKKDPVEGYYYDLGKLTKPPLNSFNASRGTIDDIHVGDKVSDYAANQTPYWEVNGVDPDKNRVYVTPIGDNPFVTGKGAGGKELDDHDFDVHSGKYEKERIDRILQNIQDKNYHDPSDVAYILLGTVPHNFGPNGAQGGWYNSQDLGSNRGGRKGMTAGQIQAADAQSLVRLKFDVPPKALQSGLRPDVWNSFVSGSSTPTPYGDSGYDDRLHGEDHRNPNAMAHHALTHPQKHIRARNANALVDYYNGRDRKPDVDREDWELQQKIATAYNDGHYKRKELEPLLRELALKLSQEKSPEYNRLGYDRHYDTRNVFINLAKREGWDDIVALFEKALDPENRRRVFDHHSGVGVSEDRPVDVRAMVRMLDHEQDAENMSQFLYRLIRLSPQDAADWRDRNEGKIQNAIRTDAIGYHGKELKNAVDYIDRARNNPWFGKS